MPLTLARSLAALTILVLTMAACGPSSDLLATFKREWGDGRVETLALYADGRVQMDHVGTIDRATLGPSDVERLKVSLSDIAPAADPSAFPRLTLTPTGSDPVVVDSSPGTTGELFMTLLNSHRLP